MRRILPYFLAITVVLAFGGTAAAQEKPEFKLGFAALAARIPDIVGTPLEDERCGPNGDSLQRTTTGLMVWRKADNWTAFTDGARTWVNGRFGIEERGNDERFDWEAEAPPAPAEPPVQTPVAQSPAPTATPTPTPMAAPKPSLRSSEPNVIQGQGLEAGSVWVLGEMHNDGAIPAYNARVTARLLEESGAVVATASQYFAFLGPGNTVGYRVEVKTPPAYAGVEVSLDASSTGVAGYATLPVTWVKNEQAAAGQSNVRYEFTGTVGNGEGQPVSLSTVYVWFLDDQNRVVWMESTHVPNSLASGDTSDFVVRTVSDRENPRISDVSQVRYYAAGRLP
ncbi:MAG: FxLYD domain-containing protein [Sphingomonadaceae bacterium]